MTITSYFSHTFDLHPIPDAFSSWCVQLAKNRVLGLSWFFFPLLLYLLSLCSEYISSSFQLTNTWSLFFITHSIQSIASSIGFTLSSSTVYICIPSSLNTHMSFLTTIDSLLFQVPFYFCALAVHSAGGLLEQYLKTKWNPKSIGFIRSLLSLKSFNWQSVYILSVQIS